MYYVYVIRSLIDQSYYVGITSSLDTRLAYHNSTTLNIGVTRLKIPWEYFFTLQVPDVTVARKIENHIKRMKSRGYFKNLVKYPEIGQKLIKKYS